MSVDRATMSKHMHLVLNMGAANLVRNGWLTAMQRSIEKAHMVHADVRLNADKRKSNVLLYALLASLN